MVHHCPELFREHPYCTITMGAVKYLLHSYQTLFFTHYLMICIISTNLPVVIIMIQIDYEKYNKRWIARIYLKKLFTQGDKLTCPAPRARKRVQNRAHTYMWWLFNRRHFIGGGRKDYILPLLALEYYITKANLNHFHWLVLFILV